MVAKINVGIIFGGKSAEHEVSLQSAKNILSALDKQKYHISLWGVNKKGQWLNEEESLLLLEGSYKESQIQSKQLFLNLPDNERLAKEKVDVFFPVMHGPFGEDGTIQGLLKLADIPFAGAGVLGSAVGMDKEIMKRLLQQAGLPIGKFLVWHCMEQADFETAVQQLGLPFFVKPANLGSSVGVSKIKSKDGFSKAINEAFAYDNKIIVEENINGREIECSVLGNENPIASLPGEVIPQHEFYSYEAKYLDDNGAFFQIPAPLPEDIIKSIQTLAIKTFQTLNCEGMGRVDFFLDGQNKIFINEINTIPGFTKISMYPKLWEVSGIGYSQLINTIIELALQRFHKEKRLKNSYTE